jgi:AcrR family transcriptional regulator
MVNLHCDGPGSAMSAATPHPQQRRRRMSRADRERQMLDVAEAVFGERGYQGTSMEEIAERCGVSKPMLYEYFGSKDGLFIACLDRSKAELLDRTQQVMAAASTPRDILWRSMVAYLEFVDAHDKSFAMLLGKSTAGSQETADAVEGIRRQQGTLISAALAEFAPRMGEPAIAAYTEIIIGASERLAQWRARNPQVRIEDAARHMTDFCWKGLSPYLTEPRARA